MQENKEQTFLRIKTEVRESNVQADDLLTHAGFEYLEPSGLDLPSASSFSYVPIPVEISL